MAGIIQALKAAKGSELVLSVATVDAWIKALEESSDQLASKDKDIERLTKRLAERRSDIDRMLVDTFKDTMNIYCAAGGKMGDTLADKMALRLGQFTMDATKFLKKDVKKPAAAPGAHDVGEFYKKGDPDKIEHPGAVCPHCKQSIILTDDGRFVTHNEPGWTDGEPNADGAWIPTKCVGSGKIPSEVQQHAQPQKPDDDSKEAWKEIRAYLLDDGDENANMHFVHVLDDHFNNTR